MRSAVGEWAEDDPTAASTYLASMPASELRDSASSGFARTIVRENPEAAIAWVGAISQDKLRTSTLTIVAKDWYRRDAEAASAWLQTSGLSTDAIQSITRGKGR